MFSMQLLPDITINPKPLNREPLNREPLLFISITGHNCASPAEDSHQNK
jgi:hypothetical protein